MISLVSPFVLINFLVTNALFTFVYLWFILIFPRCVESGVSYLSSRVERIVEASNGVSHVVCEYDIVVPCRYDTIGMVLKVYPLSIIYWNFTEPCYGGSFMVPGFPCLSYIETSDMLLQACYCCIRSSFRKTIAVWGWGSKGVCPNSIWRGSWGGRLALWFSFFLLSVFY